MLRPTSLLCWAFFILYRVIGMSSYGGDVAANELMVSLLAGENVTLPVIDLSGPEYTVPVDLTSALYQNVEPITNEMLTRHAVAGDGAFDAIMNGFKFHLKEEFDKQRISGAEYTKAFIALAEGAMNNATQFLLGKDQAFWAAARAQAEAITSRVNLAIAKVQYAAVQLEALTARANYALTKLRLATEDTTYGQGKLTVDNLLPLQILGQGYQNDTILFQLNTMMPSQHQMVLEQIESQRAQTSDTRLDGVTNIAGLLGKQKDLYNQQIESYQKDSQLKAAKVFADAWTVMHTVSDTPAPDAYMIPNISSILTKIQTENGLT